MARLWLREIKMNNNRIALRWITAITVKRLIHHARGYFNPLNYIVFRQILCNHFLTCTAHTAVFVKVVWSAMVLRKECCLSNLKSFRSFGKVSHLKMSDFMKKRKKNITTLKVWNTFHRKHHVSSHKSIQFFFLSSVFTFCVTPLIKQFENI